MIVNTRQIAAALLALAIALPVAANSETAADKSNQIAELIDLHDLKTSVSIGNYYLKQVKIMDHTVSTHVMMALSFSGKLKEVAGVEVDRTRMQDLWNTEDAEMRFSIQDATNVEGQRFALSPLGKKYFVTAILKLTGIVNRRIDEVAGMLPKQVDAYAAQVRPLLEEFKSGRG